MKYAHAAWCHERASWRAVIQLNLLRSIIAIVETLQAEMDNDPVTSRPLSPIDMNTDTLLRPSFDTIRSEDDVASKPLSVPLTDKHHILKLRLGPLRRVEADLKRRLGVASTEETAGGDVGVMGEGTADTVSSTAVQKRSREFGVRGWKDALESWTKNPKSVGSGEHQPVDDATEVIASCREDMKALWTDQTVRDILAKRRMRLQDSAGLSVFLFSFLLCSLLIAWRIIPAFLMTWIVSPRALISPLMTTLSVRVCGPLVCKNTKSGSIRTRMVH
jgi:guanine nucleotide-binding protein subunit alpha